MSRAVHLFVFTSIVCGVAHGGDAPVRLMKTPGEGIQPQVVVDGSGKVHLLYFKGNPREGDLYYTWRAPDKTDFAAPLRVNSQPASAVATGTIRGGQFAVAAKGRVHVVWNGSGKAQPRQEGKGSPMLYTRLKSDGAGFEEQRNLMTKTDVLDGGGTLAADAAGNVCVAWHGQGLGSKGEEQRQVWIARSTDGGQTFAAEQPAWDGRTGACACCGMRGLADSKGNLYFLYRSAKEGIHRDMHLLVGADQGKSFAGVMLHPWEINACPMSSEAMVEAPKGVAFAWDTAGQVYWSQVRFGSKESTPPQAAPGAAKARKHPALAFNFKGEMILVWTEGTGWQKGGGLAWQVYDSDGRPTKIHGRSPNSVPVWGLPAAIADKDGRFTIYH